MEAPLSPASLAKIPPSSSLYLKPFLELAVGSNSRVPGETRYRQITCYLTIGNLLKRVGLGERVEGLGQIF